MQKRKRFQGIHDRFLRYHEFRVRMIEHNRDEKVCRRWDVLADEDHTYHLSEQEYFYYKNKWWLNLNKSGSDTLPLRKRFDFKQALSTLQRSHQEAGEEPFVPTYSHKHKQWQSASKFVLYMVEMARFLVIFLKIRKSRKMQAESLGKELGDPLLTVFWRKPSEDGFQEFNLFCSR